jgi:hypothetical protein
MDEPVIPVDDSTDLSLRHGSASSAIYVIGANMKKDVDA